MAGSVLVGLSGIVPLLVFPDTSKLQDSSTIPLGKSHTIVQYFFYSAYHHILNSTLIVNDSVIQGVKIAIKMNQNLCSWNCQQIIKKEKKRIERRQLGLLLLIRGLLNIQSMRDWSTAPAQWDNIDGALAIKMGFVIRFFW